MLGDVGEVPTQRNTKSSAKDDPKCARLAIFYEREKDFMAKYGKSCFLMSPHERKVYKRFKVYIKNISF